MNEATTREQLIDKALVQAGWDISDPSQVGLEIPVDQDDSPAYRALMERLRREGYNPDISLPKGISDYVLYRENGEILAVVEAKRASRDPRLAEAQATFYVQEIEKRQSFRPFAFLTNGHDIYYFDTGHEARRKVAGFFSRQDLENRLFVREEGVPLSTVAIDNGITNRAYQHEAVRRVAEAFEEGKRRALLVMATGTGKTRTAMSLVDVFMRADQARRVLFVADRDALVDQALTEGFQDHLPDEPATRIYSGDLSKESRLFVVTLQTLNNIYREFSPAFFDLIVFDEVHRSIFNKWNEVVKYFDARMIGLTATPASYLDRNTFVEFGCPDNVPTFHYSHKEAVEEGHLVDYRLYSARTKFQRTGIKGADLDEEARNALIEKGIDPDELDLSGSELEKTASNRGTLREQWQEIMDVCRKDAGGLPGKTILFAMSEPHALRLEEAFNESFPQYPGLAQVITYRSEYKGTRVKTFKKESQPRIAISVDMLETGVNVPEVVNLIFMRPVQSPIKMTQMVGRGTRTEEACTHPEWLPEGGKKDFLIIDFWENTFEKDPQEAPAQSLPVLISLFNTRVKLLNEYLKDQGGEEAARLKASLRAMIERIPTESLNVREAYGDVKEAWGEEFWRYLTAHKLQFLRAKVGPLLRFAAEVDVAQETFTHKVERLKLQGLQRKNTAEASAAVAEDVSRLPGFVFDDPANERAVRLVLSPDLATASPEDLDEVIARLAPLMNKRRDKESVFIDLDLRDIIDTRSYIVEDAKGEPLYAEAYRERVEAEVQRLVQAQPAMQALQAGDTPSDEDLISLERLLWSELGRGELKLTEGNIRRAYGYRVESLLEFVRRLLEIDALAGYGEVVRRRFDAYITAHPFDAQQIRFLRTVQSLLSQRPRLSLADLYDKPLSNFGEDAVERWFTEPQIEDMLTFINSLAREPEGVARH